MSFLSRLFSRSTQSHSFTSAVILAAGVGSRFGNGDGTKQNAEVSGVPAVVRACLAFERAKSIDEVIIVGREEELERLRSYVERFDLKKVVKVVSGGATRQESSYNGSTAVSDNCRFIAIHDAARCLVTEDIIDRTVDAAHRYGAAAAAERVVDTVKIANDKGFIKETVDREKVWLVKTPQVFKFHMYETAAAIAKRDGFEATDDSSMAERCGFSVKLVDCGHENIKLTERQDLGAAEYILSKRQGDGK